MARSPRTVSAATATTRARRPAAPRTPRLVILPYGPSDSVNALANSLSTVLTLEGVTVNRLKREGSRFLGREADLLVNWGSRNETFNTARGNARVLNNIEAVTNAASKRRSFDLFQEAGVSTVESTRDHDVARGWFDEGFHVFARDEDSGHSGAGIRVMARNIETAPERESITVEHEFTNSPLYTKGAFIGQQHREFRVHVFMGKIAFIQQKKRREGWAELESYSNIVRNYHTGWIYANDTISELNDAAAYHSVEAVKSLGLDFGAVDVMTRGQEAVVLEVNTAPGLSGTNLQTYTNFIKAVFKNELDTIPSVRPLPAVDPMVVIRERLEAEAAQAAAALINPPILTRNFVKVIVSNEESVGYYDVELDAFILAGFDVPMDPSDVQIISDSI